jgi:hypothetical protein
VHCWCHLTRVLRLSGFLNKEKLTANTLGFAQFFAVGQQLPDWPSSDVGVDEKPDRLFNELIRLEKVLLEWICRDAETRGLNTEQLIEMLAREIPGAKDLFGCWNPGFDELLSVLKSAIKNGASPNEIASLIAQTYLV